VYQSLAAAFDSHLAAASEPSKVNQRTPVN
jgi:hypothetical protein